MFKTKFGAFNGDTWENLCQLIFKRKHQSEGYQEMPASPGDYGIEGYTVTTGWAFQCYCPDKHYERKELYEKQRDKISDDLKKLKTYQADIQSRLGSTKLTRWIFVTPEIDRNALLKHAKTKETEVKGWGLPFLSDDFTVLLHDGDHYLVDINEVRVASGEALVFDDTTPVLAELNGNQEEYEQNIVRKSQSRLAGKPKASGQIAQLSQRTIEHFLESEGYFRQISSSAPPTYIRLIRIINEYELEVMDLSETWIATPHELTEKVRNGLEQLIFSELSPEFDRTNAKKVARFMTARWLAICELDYE